MIDTYEDLLSEYCTLRERIDSIKSCIVTDVSTDKHTTLLSVMVIADKKSRRAVVQCGSHDVYTDLRDGDLNLCSDVICSIMDGLHFKISKCYCTHDSSGAALANYYVKPDWKYWHSGA